LPAVLVTMMTGWIPDVLMTRIFVTPATRLMVGLEMGPLSTVKANAPPGVVLVW